MELYTQIATKIIEQQEQIIGPIAIEQAEQITMFTIDWSKHSVDINGDPIAAIDELVDQYAELFGPIAVQVSKDITADIVSQLPDDKKPSSLK